MNRVLLISSSFNVEMARDFINSFNNDNVVVIRLDNADLYSSVCRVIKEIPDVFRLYCMVEEKDRKDAMAITAMASAILDAYSMEMEIGKFLISSNNMKDITSEVMAFRILQDSEDISELRERMKKLNWLAKNAPKQPINDLLISRYINGDEESEECFCVKLIAEALKSCCREPVDMEYDEYFLAIRLGIMAQYSNDMAKKRWLVKEMVLPMFKNSD